MTPQPPNPPAVPDWMRALARAIATWFGEDPDGCEPRVSELIARHAPDFETELAQATLLLAHLHEEELAQARAKLDYAQETIAAYRTSNMDYYTQLDAALKVLRFTIAHYTSMSGANCLLCGYGKTANHHAEGCVVGKARAALETPGATP